MRPKKALAYIATLNKGQVFLGPSAGPGAGALGGSPKDGGTAFWGSWKRSWESEAV